MKVSKILNPPDDDEQSENMKAFERDERIAIAHEATGEIEALIGMMRREIANGDPQLITVLLGALRRIKDLNSVVMSAVGGDDSRTTDEMSKIVYDDNRHLDGGAQWMCASQFGVDGSVL